MDPREEKMQEIGLARAMASMPSGDDDLLRVAKICRKYLGRDTVAGGLEGAALAPFFNSKAREEVRLALNIIAAEHARGVLQSEETAAGLDQDGMQRIFGYANLNDRVWDLVDDWGPAVRTMVSRFPELTPARINAVMPDFSRPSFMKAPEPRARGHLKR